MPSAAEPDVLGAGVGRPTPATGQGPAGWRGEPARATDRTLFAYMQLCINWILNPTFLQPILHGD